MELDPSSLVSPTAGGSIGKNHHPQLANDGLVSDGLPDINRGPDPSPTPPRSASSRKRKRHSLQEPSLDHDGLAGWTRSDWKPQTINTNKCAILAMYQEENDAFNNHPYAKHLVTQVKRKDLKVIKNTPVDISPILTLFRAWGPNDSLPIDNLVCKLAWLLGVCGFLRPDDVRCINVARSTIDAAGILSFQVVAPKEKVDGSSTVVKVHISPTSNPLICPVQAYSAYLTHLPVVLTYLTHHKSTRTTPRLDTVPLLRHQDDPSQALASSTIGTKMNSITDHMTFPPDTIRPSCRAIGSTLAAFHDVTTDEVKKHGRWSPLSATFEKFYRLNRNSAINFSSIVLADSGSTASVSGRHNGE